jgi:hypothetical protein
MFFQQLSDRFAIMGNQLVTIDTDEIKHIQTVEYLSGFSVPGLGKLYSTKAEKNRIPLLASPFVRHMNAVNRFLFSGGVKVDVVGQVAPDPRQEWVDLMADHIKLDSLVDTIWEQGAITGEVFIAFHQNVDRFGNPTEFFDIRVYDKTEFVPQFDTWGNLEQVEVLSVRTRKDERGKLKEVLFKAIFSTEFYMIWPEVDMKDAKMGRFPEPTITPHRYQFVPGVVIKNKGQDPTERGESQFDQAAIDMACEVVLQMADASSNFHYFGHQIIVSPDVEETVKNLRSRSRVLQKLPNEDGGSPEVLSMDPVPDNHEKFIDRIEESLMDHLGTPIVESKGGVSREVSSLTLRILHSEAIATANRKWSAYVDDGIEPLFSKLLLAAGFEGILGQVTPLNPDTHKVAITRRLPFFPESPVEKSQKLDVVDRLVILGVNKAEALSREFFTNMSAEEVLELLDGDF